MVLHLGVVLFLKKRDSLHRGVVLFLKKRGSLHRGVVLFLKRYCPPRGGAFSKAVLRFVHTWYFPLRGSGFYKETWYCTPRGGAFFCEVVHMVLQQL